MLSVVIPAHNERRQLGYTLTALQESLRDFPVPSEILVVDDASTDGTADIARSFGARVIRVECRHIAATRNAGGNAAHGEWLLFLDADTTVRAEHLQEAGCALKHGWSGGARVVMDEPPGWFGLALLKLFSLLYFRLAGMAAGCFLFMTKRDFDRLGGFDETLFAGEDSMMSLGLKHKGPHHIIENPVATSARKIKLHSPLKIFGTFLRVLFLGFSALRSRKGLEFWYDGRR